ncbi:MAG: response regulator transcription factor [Galbitalea sp.]
MSEVIRVAIADDQVLFCSGIEMLVRSQDDLEFVGAAYDGEQILELVEREHPDVVLMDIRMPKADGISATQRIRAAGGAPRVIVLTTHQRDVAVLGAINAGASGFLMKDATPDFLLASIRAVHSGKSVIAPATPPARLFDVGATSQEAPNEQAIGMLSGREREIFLLAARGLSTAEIAAQAFVTESTVKSHISSILAKMELTSRLQLVALAHANRLVR